MSAEQLVLNCIKNISYKICYSLCCKAIEIKLTEDPKAQLEKLTRGHSAKRRLVERAAIILACAVGKQNLEVVAAEHKMSAPRVSKWRRRFTEKSAAIIELYLNPPLNALVLSGDEKTLTIYGGKRNC